MELIGTTGCVLAVAINASLALQVQLDKNNMRASEAPMQMLLCVCLRHSAFVTEPCATTNKSLFSGAMRLLPFLNCTMTTSSIWHARLLRHGEGAHTTKELRLMLTLQLCFFATCRPMLIATLVKYNGKLYPDCTVVASLADNH